MLCIILPLIKPVSDHLCPCIHPVSFFLSFFFFSYLELVVNVSLILFSGYEEYSFHFKAFSRISPMILEECQFKQDVELTEICIYIEELPGPARLKSPDNTTTIFKSMSKTVSPLSSKYVYDHRNRGVNAIILIYPCRCI